MWFFLLFGSILFLIMKLPIIFWLVAVPLGTTTIVNFIVWLKK